MMTKRTCLRCGKKFSSKSSANRICNLCRARKGPNTQSVKMKKKLSKALMKKNIKPESWHGRMFSEEQ